MVGEGDLASGEQQQTCLVDADKRDMNRRNRIRAVKNGLQNKVHGNNRS